MQTPFTMTSTEVRTLSGETILVTTGRTEIADLKNQLAANLGVPSLCLELVADGAIPDDSQAVGDPISLVLTVTTAKACALASSSPEEITNSGTKNRCDAIDALSRVARRGDTHVTDSVRPCLKNSDASLRASAVNALAKAVCPDADEAAFAELCASLQDADLGVRITAVSALADTAYEATPATNAAMNMAIIDLTTEITDRELDLDLQTRALRALAKAAKTYHAETISAFISRLESVEEDCAIRRMAAGALSRLARDGNQRAAEALQAHRTDGDSVIRRAALKCWTDRVALVQKAAM